MKRRNAADVRRHQRGGPGFQELCAGQIDLVDSARPISRAEWVPARPSGSTSSSSGRSRGDRRRHQPETDVGADCLSTDQVRDILASRLAADQLGQDPLNYDDVPPAGPEAPTPPTRASRSSGATSWLPPSPPGRPALRLLPRPVRRGRQGCSVVAGRGCASARRASTPRACAQADQAVQDARQGSCRP